MVINWSSKWIVKEQKILRKIRIKEEFRKYYDKAQQVFNFFISLYRSLHRAHFSTKKNIILYVVLITENVTELKNDSFPTIEKHKVLSKHHQSKNDAGFLNYQKSLSEAALLSMHP